jgi:hypothetical protein
MQNFNIYTYLNQNNLEFITKYKRDCTVPRFTKRSNSVSYWSGIVKNKLTGEELFLHSHNHLNKGKEYNFLVDIDGNVNKINGGLLGKTFIYDAVVTLEYRHYNSTQTFE